MGFKPPVEVLRTEAHFDDSYGRGTHYCVGRRSFDGKRGRSLYLQDEVSVGVMADILDNHPAPDKAIEAEWGDFIDMEPLEDILTCANP